MAKVKKSAVKVVKKKWVMLYASPEFNKQKIGETYVVETEQALNKHITVNLMSLTMDPKKQNLSVSFVSEKIEGDGVACRVTGYKMSPVSMKKIVRRNRTKVADSFTVTTKDGKHIRIKPLIVTRGHASKATCTEIRKQARAAIAVTLKKITFSQLITQVIQRKFQKQLSDLLRKTFPISVCEIRAFSIISGDEPVSEKKEAKNSATEAKKPAKAEA